MRGRKPIDSNSDIAAAEKLAGDEEITIVDTRKIRRSKVVEEEPPETETNFIDIDEETGEGIFPDGTLGALITNDDEASHLLTQQCNIIVVRKVDSPGEKFIKPCSSKITEAPLRNIELTTSQSDIEEMVRTYYGGGHYYLQIQMGNQMQRGWTCDLADTPEAIAQAKREAAAAFNPTQGSHIPAAAADETDPIDRFIQGMERQQKLRDVLFGPELAELERLRRLAESKPAMPENEKLLMLEKALAMTNPTIQDRLLNSIFPVEDENSHWIVDGLKFAIEHKAEVGGLLQMVLGGILGGGAPPAARPIADIMRGGPPAADQTPAGTSQFKRKTPGAALNAKEKEATTQAAAPAAGDPIAKTSEAQTVGTVEDSAGMAADESATKGGKAKNGGRKGSI